MSFARLAARSVSRLPAVSRVPAVQKRTFLTLKDIKYTAHATAKGEGRNGEAKSGKLELDLALPKELGGTGKGANPEQLFAMGCASCLLGAIQLSARKMGKPEAAKNAIVHTNVHIGEPNEVAGFGLAVDIEVENVPEDVLKAGHEACPYSRALNHGIVVNVKKA